MAGTRKCSSAVTAGRLSKAVEFFDAAEHLQDDMPHAAADRRRPDFFGSLLMHSSRRRSLLVTVPRMTTDDPSDDGHWPIRSR